MSDNENDSNEMNDAVNHNDESHEIADTISNDENEKKNSTKTKELEYIVDQPSPLVSRNNTKSVSLTRSPSKKTTETRLSTSLASLESSVSKKRNGSNSKKTSSQRTSVWQKTNKFREARASRIASSLRASGQQAGSVQLSSITNSQTSSILSRLSQPGAFRVSTQNNDDVLEEEDSAPISVPEEAKDEERGDVVPTEHTYTVEARLVEDDSKHISMSDRELIREEIRRDIMRQTVIGQVLIEDDATKKKHRLLLIIAVCVVVIIGVVAGVSIFATNSNNQGKDEAGGSIPSLSPTFTPGPTSSPSSLPSLSPSSFPTMNISGLDNGRREEAHHIYLEGAKLESNLNQLAIYQEFPFETLHGGLAMMASFGLWYKYYARRSGPVTVIVCGGFETAQIYSETYSALGADNDVRTPLCGSISIWTEEGKNYFIFVDGGNDPQQIPASNFTIEIGSNRQCKFVYGPVKPTSAGVSFVDSVSNTIIKSDKIPPCGGASSSNQGVWYRVRGTGQPLTVSTCSDKTSFDTQLSVFKGFDCSALECINGNNDFCGTSSSVVWPSEEDIDYHVFIHGGVGDFEVTFETEVRRPENDFCSSASLLPMGGIDLDFTFEGSTVDAEVPSCDIAIPNENTSIPSSLPYGIWYKIVGDSTTDAISLKLTSFNGGGSNPARMQVYVGSCGRLLCAPSRMPMRGCDINKCTEQVCLPTLEDETYYVFVSTNSLDSFTNRHRISAKAAMMNGNSGRCRS